MIFLIKIRPITTNTSSGLISKLPINIVGQQNIGWEGVMAMKF